MTTKTKAKKAAAAKPQEFRVPTHLRAGHTLMLRTCDAEMKAHGGFTWPRSGPVECPDWKPTKEFGNGLHGFLRGCGAGRFASWAPDAVWMVVEVRAADVVDLGDKVKVPRGRVLFAGERSVALALMAKLGHLDDGHIGGTATAGDGGTATAGYGGTATAGYGGTATAGYGGTLILKWWDPKAEKYRRALAEVGENGIVAGKRYQLDEAGKFVRVERLAAEAPAT